MKDYVDNAATFWGIRPQFTVEEVPSVNFNGIFIPTIPSKEVNEDLESYNSVLISSLSGFQLNRLTDFDW